MSRRDAIKLAKLLFALHKSGELRSLADARFILECMDAVGILREVLAEEEHRDGTA